MTPASVPHFQTAAAAPPSVVGGPVAPPAVATPELVLVAHFVAE